MTMYSKTLLVFLLLLRGVTPNLYAQEEREIIMDEGAQEMPAPNDNLQPLDPAYGVVFDSLFPLKPKRIFRQCHITVIDSTGGAAKEKIEVTFNAQGQALRLDLFCDNSGESCRKIVCTYNGALFYSMRSLSKSSEKGHFFTCTRNANSVLQTTWGAMYAVADTSGKPDSKSYLYKNIAGKDSCARIVTPEVRVVSTLTDVTMLEDTLEIQTLDVSSEYLPTAKRKNFVMKVVTETNKAGQVLRKDLSAPKEFARHLYTYDAHNRMIRYQAFSGSNAGSYDIAADVTFERNKTGDPVKVHYKAPGYNTLYLLEWK